MRKEEFFKRLEYLLQDMPEQDKEEALQYYRDYLEEAGPEREEKVIGEFGSPERVAAIIRADLMGNLEDGGSFTETGYEDERFRDPNYQVAKRYDLPEKKEPERQESHTEYREKKVHETYRHVKQERWTSKPLKIMLLAVLLILASPFHHGRMPDGGSVPHRCDFSGLRHRLHVCKPVRRASAHRRRRREPGMRPDWAGDDCGIYRNVSAVLVAVPCKACRQLFRQGEGEET